MRKFGLVKSGLLVFGDKWQGVEWPLWGGSRGCAVLGTATSSLLHSSHHRTQLGSAATWWHLRENVFGRGQSMTV